MSNSDTVLFVQGIPIDLDRKGLANLFTRAGPIKNVRIIPPKNSTYTSTFGFVEFSNRTIAATALEMFNNYKIGTKYLNVTYAQQRTQSQQDNGQSRNSVALSSRPLSRLSNHDLNRSSDSDKLSRKSSMGRGSLIHQNQPRYQRGNYDLSRPFARKVLSRQNPKIVGAKEPFVDADEQESKIISKSNEELKIGELYPVYITHVNTPSNFFVHLITSKEKVGNLVNNMDNYYRNGFHEENADLNKFCETKPASIRCRLADIRPPRGSSEWSQRAQETMDTLYKQEDALFAKIVSVDEFEPSSGRFETIYGVDLIYGGEESIISYFIQNGLAIHIEDGVELNECELNLYFRKNSVQPSTLVDQDTFESRTIDETIDEMMLNLSSVSLANLNEQVKIENVHIPKSLIESNNRSKLFNSLFRVFKKKDINPSIQLYKCSQVLDAKLVHIEDHLEFYIQPASKLTDLEHLENCLNQYAKTLTNDQDLLEELRTFQNKTSRFDVVLVRHESQWKRAVFLERTSTSTLCSMFDHEELSMNNETNFFSFFLIDWGREILIKRNSLSDIYSLFILPYDEKLNKVGSFALKCKISEHQIKLREKISSEKMNQSRKDLFNKKFKEYFREKVLRMRISQIVNVKNELTATVDLYFLPDQIQSLLKLEVEQIRQIKSNINRTNVNCVQFVLDQIKQVEQTEKENDNVPMINNNFVKLNPGQEYNVNIQFFDETYESPYFFVSLSDELAKLELLDIELQKISSDKTKFRYVEKIGELKLNDTLEALFENDSKWYRVQVRALNPLEIYFLDFGNSETIVQLVPKTLRYRLKFDSNDEIDLFQLDYQAVRCRYESNTENKLSEFLEKLSLIEDAEVGFQLTILERDSTKMQESYLVSLDEKKSESKKIEEKSIEEAIEQMDDDDEEKVKASIQLETDSVIDGVSFVHIESVHEFYVQTQDTLRLFIDFQAKLQRVLELMVANESSCKHSKQEIFKKGDFVFAKFLSDLNWYRAVIINIEKATNEKNEFSHLANDGLIYDVYFVDYGNKQEHLPSSLLFSFDSVKQLNKNLNLMPGKDLDYIIEMPFQAICCQLVDKKNNTRNNEILKSLVHECLNFSIKIAATCKESILDYLKIDKYLVYLSTDDNSLQDQFENETKSEIKFEINVNSVYECKLSNLDKYIYVNLFEQADDFLKLETQLTSDTKIESNWSLTMPNVGDLVLAKFQLDQQTSAWCRAIIVNHIVNKTNKNNALYNVFYIDYGNQSINLSLEDLAPIQPQYSLAKYPAFAHKILISQNELLDMQKYDTILTEFLDDNMKIKILDIQPYEYCNCYLVELWNWQMSKCFNKLIAQDIDDDAGNDANKDAYNDADNDADDDGQQDAHDHLNLSDKIEHSKVQELYLANKSTELKVSVKYAYMEDLLRPFYFCLSDDLDMRTQMDHELNEFYSENKLEKAQTFSINAYVAVYSENSWYRAQIKQIFDTNSILLFFIDYGYDELIDLNESNENKIGKLDARFYKYPKFVFGTALINPMATKADSYELINFESNDNSQMLRETLEEYLLNSEQFDLVILAKILPSSLNQYFMPNEDYYGIEMYNAKSMCLNEIILTSKEKQVLKAKRPASIKVNIDQMPKQQPLNDKYCVFARSLDDFYVYNEDRVLQVQLKTQQACAKILQDMKCFDTQEQESLQMDDLVYAMYDDDETWYRCQVTNYDQKSSQVELFYLDFGNIEIVSLNDVLTGWTQEHIEAFMAYEPLAYKCCLYGLVDKQYTLEEKNKFKHFTSDKVFDVNFIKVNENELNEVSLEIVDKPETNVHMLCINEGIARFKSFDQILKLNRTDKENKFYINLLNGF